MYALRWRFGAVAAVIAVGTAALLVIGTISDVSSPSLSLVMPPDDVVRQRSRDDCGVAVMAMLLRQLGRPIDLERLWVTTIVPPGGLSIEDLRSTAARHGVRLTALDGRRERLPASAPWIAHLAWKHYVLVEGQDDGDLVIADPRGYRYVMSAESFRRVWSGHGLIVASSASAAEVVERRGDTAGVFAASGTRAS